MNEGDEGDQVLGGTGDVVAGRHAATVPSGRTRPKQVREGCGRPVRRRCLCTRNAAAARGSMATVGSEPTMHPTTSLAALTPPRGPRWILHVDLDAFFASVEQRDKPSLRGKPVVVGGVGGRGVVATASYEARVHGVHSAMPTAEARRRCPTAASLPGRFNAYREASRAVMELLRGISPLVEPLSLDEAFVDLAAADLPDSSVATVSAFARELKDRVHDVTGGLTGSVGIGTSKFIAKIASDLDKPDGLVVVAAGNERDLLRPMQVTVIPGVGPATAEHLRRIGVHTVADLEEISEDELVRVVGRSHGRNLYLLARAEDDRPVVAEREAKSISVE